ncbi:hypothetical protein LLH23_00020 [bacterium]|nr:hypothetical protein [bacterium]
MLLQRSGVLFLQVGAIKEDHMAMLQTARGLGNDMQSHLRGETVVIHHNQNGRGNS